MPFNFIVVIININIVWRNLYLTQLVHCLQIAITETSLQTENTSCRHLDFGLITNLKVSRLRRFSNYRTSYIMLISCLRGFHSVSRTAVNEFEHNRFEMCNKHATHNLQIVNCRGISRIFIFIDNLSNKFDITVSFYFLNSYNLFFIFISLIIFYLLILFLFIYKIIFFCYLINYCQKSHAIIQYNKNLLIIIGLLISLFFMLYL